MRSFAIDDRSPSDEHVVMTIQTSRLRWFHVCGTASVLDKRAILRLKWTAERLGGRVLSVITDGDELLRAHNRLKSAIVRDGFGEDMDVIAGGWLRAR